jgi:CRISPR-associated endonuclease/helicase Cas3
MNELGDQLWAKTDRGTPPRWHPLLFHMYDAGQMALALWNESLAPAVQRKFAGWLGCAPAEAARTLSFWVALHDLGKASPAFQAKAPTLQVNLTAQGLGFPALPAAMPHGLVTAWALKPLLPATGLSPKESRLIARALAGHHGSWPTDLQLHDLNEVANLGGTYQPQWAALRAWLFDVLRTAFQPAPARLPTETAQRNAFLALFSGFVSTADWVASMEDRFPYADSRPAWAVYQEKSAGQAKQAVRELGFRNWKPDGSSFDFQSQFHFPPNEIQSAVIREATGLSQPAMLIVEAPTGCGKTEMAFSVVDAWLQRSGGQGLYVAMPTTATSNQMFHRTRDDYLQPRYPESPDGINLQLAHSAAQLDDDFQKMVIRSVGDDVEAGEGSIAAMSWFLPRKRTLLAPFAVGTVDQALLSVLQTRHFFVRLFGLGGKVIMFDEVHAYDTYMSSLFCRLLAWLRAASVSVVLLSATLPSATRRRLVEAYSGEGCPPLDAGYPSATLVEPGRGSSLALPAPESRSVALQWAGAAPEEVVAALRTGLVDGGCAVVICNTVRRAQTLYRAIRDARLCPPEDCLLFHASYPFDRRQEIERLVVDRFGKVPPAGRPCCSILVATQVVEQSLDLDFDVMVTDLAPIDLLIQRVGRLHRHRRERPARLTTPTLTLCNSDPLVEDPDAPAFGDSRYVYEPYLLWRTWAILQGRCALSLPKDTPTLIEAVYGPTEPVGLQPFQARVDQALAKMQDDQAKAEQAAQMRLILPPDDDGLLHMTNETLNEEDPAVHQSLQAMTRLAPPNVQVICLHRLTNGELNTRPDGHGLAIDLAQTPDHAAQLALLRAAIGIHQVDVVRYFLHEKSPHAWAKVAALKFHRLAVFTQGVCRPEGTQFCLVLDPETGLSITKEV